MVYTKSNPSLTFETQIKHLFKIFLNYLKTYQKSINIKISLFWVYFEALESKVILVKNITYDFHYCVQYDSPFIIIMNLDLR